MRQDCWQVWPDRGFLLKPDPVVRLSAALEGFPISASDLAHTQALADDLPLLLQTHRARTALEELPAVDLWSLHAELDSVDFRVIERLMQIYSFFASAYIYAPDEVPVKHIPAGVAVPLVQLADMVERPPILSYCGYVLDNFERIDPNGSITVDNTRLVQSFLGSPDESWFMRIHIEIEMRAAGALAGIQQAADAAAHDDADSMETALKAVVDSVSCMMKTFNRMREGCDPDTYYFKVRPYLFGFTDVVYEGAFDNQPQTFRGQTGAQSSVVPAIIAALGLEHQASELTRHLVIMKDYMPKPHRDFVTRMGQANIREAVLRQSTRRSLAESYNEALSIVLKFRRLHYHYAATYIAEKSGDPVGTGGTVFMQFLDQLIQETERQFV